MAVAIADRERARADIDRLVPRGLSVADFSRAVTRILARVVPSDGTCVVTVDPATLLPTGEVVENGLPAAATLRLTEIEIREPDFNKFTSLARARRPAASLSDVTAGDLDRSLRQRELRRPHGYEDELRAVFSGATGTWGALTLMREARRPHFSPAEVRFVASLAGSLADGLRRAMMLGQTAVDGGDDDAGLLVLTADNRVELANRSADRWLDELGAGDRADGLPVVVRAVADRTRRAAGGEGWNDAGAGGEATDGAGAGAHGGGIARARVRTVAGRWVVVRGSLLGEGPDSRVAVMLEAARAPELAQLIVEAYGFTARERLVTEFVAKGLSTNEIAERLHLSAYTVQDHLKSIFEKSGTSSRGDLVARLFFDHYAPRLTAATDASEPDRAP